MTLITTPSDAPNATRNRCNVCGAPFAPDRCETVRVRSNVRRFSNQTFEMWRCDRCRCIHCRNVVDLAHYYLDYGTKDQRLDFFSRRAYGQLLKRLRAAGLQKRHRLLDYGCGSGNFVTFLRQHGWSHAVGYDPYGDAEGFGNPSVLRPGAYDFLCLQDVIEHVEDARGLLKELAGYLRDGGVLSVGTPSADFIDLNRPHRHLHQLHAPYHLHLYTRAALEQLSEPVGLSPIGFYDRYYMETPVFGMNEAFCRRYLERLDDNIDALVEPPRVGLVLRSPTLLFHGAFGYWYSPRHSMNVVFRKTGGSRPT